MKESVAFKAGVHTNECAPDLRSARPEARSRVTRSCMSSKSAHIQPILRENLGLPVVRSQPIATALIPDACLNTRWHHGASDLLATVLSDREQTYLKWLVIHKDVLVVHISRWSYVTIEHLLLPITQHITATRQITMRAYSLQSIVGCFLRYSSSNLVKT